MKLAELRARRLQLTADMRKLTELDNMTAEQAAEFDDLQIKLADVDGHIRRLETVDAEEQRNSQHTTRAEKPGGMAATVKNIGDNEANAWGAYLRDGDRSGLRHLFQTGVQLARNRGLWEAGEGVSVRRREFAERLTELARHMRTVNKVAVHRLQQETGSEAG